MGVCSATAAGVASRACMRPSRALTELSANTAAIGAWPREAHGGDQAESMRGVTFVYRRHARIERSHSELTSKIALVWLDAAIGPGRGVRVHTRRLANDAGHTREGYTRLRRLSCAARSLMRGDRMSLTRLYVIGESSSSSEVS